MKFEIVYRVTYEFCGKQFIRKLKSSLLSDYLLKLIDCECDNVDVVMVDVVECAP